MLGLGWKVSGIVAVVGLLGIGYSQWQVKTLQVDNAGLHAELAQLRANAQQLKAANEQQAVMVENLLSAADKNSDRLDELGRKYNEAFVMAGNIELKLAELRQTEGVRALEVPYARGNAAHERLGDVLQFITQGASGGRQGQDNPDDTGTVDTRPD